MEKKEYLDLVKNTTPKPNKFKNIKVSFLTGGLIGSISETISIVLINYLNITREDATSIILITLIFLSCLFTALFNLDRLVVKLKAGLIVPITGFAHSIQSSQMDYKKDGFVTGVGSNAFKLAGSVIIYGIISAFFFAILKVIIYG